MRRGRRWSMDSEKMTATPVLIVHKIRNCVCVYQTELAELGKLSFFD
jgi:hypothetical protein